MAKASDNLIPQAHKLTVEEQSRGGKASAEAKKQNRTLMEIMTQWANKEISDEKAKRKLTAMGFEGKLTNKILLGVGMIEGALKKGNVNCFDRALMLANEPLPKEEVTINVKQNPFEGMTTEELRKLVEDD